VYVSPNRAHQFREQQHRSPSVAAASVSISKQIQANMEMSSFGVLLFFLRQKHSIRIKEILLMINSPWRNSRLCLNRRPSTSQTIAFPPAAGVHWGREGEIILDSELLGHPIEQSSKLMTVTKRRLKQIISPELMILL
jgi:hypothetical protein